MNVARRFSENLTHHRKQVGLSQEQLGFEAGMHRTAIGLLERGARVPRIDTLIKLATVLDIDPRDLLEGIIWRAGSSSPGRFD